MERRDHRANMRGGHIINLDGLVNNDIYPYAIKNELPVYLRKKDIGYVIDFEPMFTLYTKRGGYDDPDFSTKTGAYYPIRSRSI
ncbi:MAG: hypothetical protein IPN58_08060 [Anaerolineales bacterium]|nr:hypothetical protein [Anaerolineales bacterium]